MNFSFLGFFLLVFFLISHFPILATPDFAWPIYAENLRIRLTSLFGESREDHFHNGVDISSENEPVRSIGDGVLLYSRYASDDPFANEWGSGNCIWIAHANGFISGYFHLKDGREENLFTKEDIHKGEVIGKSGNTGHSSGSHLHFILAKENGAKIINPLPYLPFMEDTKPPQIGQLIINVDDKFTYVNSGDNINISRAFPISISIIDGIDKVGLRRGIQKAIYKFNGKKIKEAKFNQISLKGNVWVNEDGYSFDELYYKGNYFIGELSFVSGENVVEVEATDFNGNSTKKIFAFNVNRIR